MSGNAMTTTEAAQIERTGAAKAQAKRINRTLRQLENGDDSK
jgi:hypothetical protein